MLIATIISCVLMLPKIYSELFGVDAPPSKAGYSTIVTNTEGKSAQP